MEYTFQYYDSEERQNIINNNGDKYLKAEKNIREGNFLVFTDVKPLEIAIEELHRKLSMQDATMEELMFVILPELTGGGM